MAIIGDTVNPNGTLSNQEIHSIIFIVLNNQLAKYAKFHMSYNDTVLVLGTTPLKLQRVVRFPIHSSNGLYNVMVQTCKNKY